MNRSVNIVIIRTWLAGRWGREREREWEDDERGGGQGRWTNDICCIIL
jgi:hypothetical protein